MSTKQWQKFPTLFSLYIAQSVPMSFFSTVVPVIMRQEHYSLESIGLLQLIKLPWIFKFLWAPIVDNNAATGKQLRRWIVLSEIFYAVIIVAVGFLNLQTDFKLIITLIVMAFIASGTQDIATDVFAIRVLKGNEKCTGNGIQSAGSFIGSLFGTGVLLLAYYYFGWQALLWLLAAFVIIAVVPVCLYKPDIDIDKQNKRKVNIADIFGFFCNVKTLKRIPLLLLYYSGIIGILTMLKPYLVDLGYNVKQIGFMSGIVGTSVATLAALISGVIISKIGRTKSIYLFAFINLFAAFYFFTISKQPPTLAALYAAIALVWGAYGLSTVIIYTTSMDAVRHSSQGTDFTLQIVLTHFGSLIISVLSGKVGDNFGYRGVFTAEIVLCLITIGILLFIYPVKLRNANNKKLSIKI